ncbi:MAG: hypothetical protein Q8S13_03595 [Dehalococcoidia bacterium]|nr:hypothetical protein [Dehalococcoidia bacterium]
MTAETSMIEKDESGVRVSVVYRVRVCVRCGHAACPGCNGTWCDRCFDETADAHPECAEQTRCSYEEPDDQAVVEVRREPYPGVP